MHIFHLSYGQNIPTSKLMATIVILTSWFGCLEALATPISGNDDVARLVKQVEIKNKTNKIANDLHIEIGHRKQDIKSFSCTPFATCNDVMESLPGGSPVTIEMGGGGTVAANAAAKVQITLKKGGDVIVNKAFWTGTDIDATTPGRNIPLNSFGNVEDLSSGFENQYRISNELDELFGVTGLQFLTDVPLIPIADLFVSDPLGFGPAIPDFILSPGQSMLFGIPQLASGNVYYVRGEIFDVATGIVSSSFIDGFAVPEPATIALMGIGLAGIGFARRRMLSFELAKLLPRFCFVAGRTPPMPNKAFKAG